MFINKTIAHSISSLTLAGLMTLTAPSTAAAADNHKTVSVDSQAHNTVAPTTVTHAKISVDGIAIAYREAGPKDAPTIILLHGYPTSSHMYRNLMRDLAKDYHTIAPDYPGFGTSQQPPMAEFEYSFANLARLMNSFIEKKGIQQYSLYLMDYGAPIGLRIATAHPERVQALIVQNGAAYAEGLEEFWDPIKKYWGEKSEANAAPLRTFHSPAGLKWQYTHGTGERQQQVSPDNWRIDLAHLTRPENGRIQLELFHDYQTNVKLYPQFQQYFRSFQPPTLIVYGKNDHIFPEAGAHAFKKDLKDIEFNLFDTGHFALETHGKEIAGKIRSFMDRKVK